MQYSDRFSLNPIAYRMTENPVYLTVSAVRVEITVFAYLYLKRLGFFRLTVIIECAWTRNFYRPSAVAPLVFDGGDAAKAFHGGICQSDLSAISFTHRGLYTVEGETCAELVEWFCTN